MKLIISSNWLSMLELWTYRLEYCVIKTRSCSFVNVSNHSVVIIIKKGSEEFRRGDTSPKCFEILEIVCLETI